MEQPRTPPTPEGAQIASDLTCIRCGYNLRMLSPRARCPECGALVARSLNRRLLRFADGRDLQRLRVALRICIGAVLASSVVEMFGGIRYFFRGLSAWIFHHFLAYQLSFGLIDAIARAAFPLGLLILVWPPSRVEAGSMSTLGSFLRWLIGLRLIVEILHSPLLFLKWAAPFQYGWRLQVIVILDVISTVLALLYLRRLSLRTRDPRADRWRYLAIAYLIYEWMPYRLVPFLTDSGIIKPVMQLSHPLRQLLPRNYYEIRHFWAAILNAWLMILLWRLYRRLEAHQVSPGAPIVPAVSL